MSFERYLTGNRVYRHGSSAPTVGRVNPSGYVERELRKKRMFAPMEPSQSRSGFAQAALQRLSGMQQPGRITPTRTRPRPAVTNTFGSGGNASGMAGGMPGVGMNKTALHAKLAATRAQHMAEQQAHLAQIRAKQASRPKVSPVGKVTSTKKVAAKPKPTALPWDLQAQQGKNDAGYALGQLRNQILMQRQQAQRDYTGNLQDLDMQQPEEERGLLNQFASRGMPFSSGYGMGVGKLQNQFAGARSGLKGNLTDALTGLQNQETEGSAHYNRTLANIQQALAQRLSKRAGSLGFGK